MIPVLREQTHIAGAIRHFTAMLDSADDVLLIVTTSREDHEAHSGRSSSTADVVDENLVDPRVHRIHYSEVDGLKSDQLNFGVRWIDENCPQIKDESLIIVYDADSRPDPAAIAEFLRCAEQFHEVDIFHQSAVFMPPDSARGVHRVWSMAEALRANRFVLLYELPRLIRRIPPRGLADRVAASTTFTHVTGHGLALRKGYMRRYPFPGRTPVEDMHFSFGLSVRGDPVIPLRTFDRSEVPGDPVSAFQQAQRWFLGPSRVRTYLKVYGQGSRRSALIATSATLITLEWLSCSVAPVALITYGVRGAPHLRVLVTVFVVLTCAELVTTVRCTKLGLLESLQAIGAYPAVSTSFGVAGLVSLVRSSLRRSVQVKVER